MEHEITFEAETLMDHGVPIDRQGNPSAYSISQPTGRCSCSCGWSGTSAEAKDHIDRVRQGLDE